MECWVQENIPIRLNVVIVKCSAVLIEFNRLLKISCPKVYS